VSSGAEPNDAIFFAEVFAPVFRRRLKDSPPCPKTQPSSRMRASRGARIRELGDKSTNLLLFLSFAIVGPNGVSIGQRLPWLLFSSPNIGNPSPACQNPSHALGCARRSPASHLAASA